MLFKPGLLFEAVESVTSPGRNGHLFMSRSVSL